MEGGPLGIGIIGAGHVLRRHATAYRALPHLARLVGVADVDRRRAQAAKDTFGFAEAFDDYHALLARDDVHAVSICTPANLHGDVVRRALEAGKHVLCEKPMATSLADADAVIGTAEEHPDRTLCYGFQIRINPAFARAKRMIELGHLGRIIRGSMVVSLSKKPEHYAGVPGRGSWGVDGGGVLINQSIHQLDGLLMLCGEPAEVSAAMGTFVQPCEAEDTLVGWVRFENGAIASIDCTVSSYERFFRIDVLGDRASIRIAGDPDGHRYDWQVRAHGKAAKSMLKRVAFREVPEPKEPPKLVSRLRKLGGRITRKPMRPPDHWEHIPLVRAFLEAAARGEPGPMPATEARRSLELALALYHSAREGTPVSLPLSPAVPAYQGMAAVGTPVRVPSPRASTTAVPAI
jgi:predicted dehydrogenase